MLCSTKPNPLKVFRAKYWRLLHSVHNIAASSRVTRSKIENNQCLSKLSKSGELDEARQLFDAMPERDEFSWNIIISGYASASRFSEARKIFNESPYKSSITWNALISGYCRHGYGNDAFELFWQMQYGGFKPTEFTVASILGLFSKSGYLLQGKQLHSYAVKTQLDVNIFVVTSLVDMYAKYCCILEAECVFQTFPGMKNHVFWTAMLTGYSQNGHGHKAIECFRDMHLEGMKSNQFAFSSILTACTSIQALEFGQQVHCWLIKCGLGDNIYVQSSLLDMYAKCGNLDKASYILESLEVDNVIAWNSMIAGCVREGFAEEALSYFKMMHSRGMNIDAFTLPIIMKNFASKSSVQVARSIHCLAVKTGYACYNHVSNALVDLYGKQGNLDCASKIFNELSDKDIVSWTSLISSYSYNGCNEEAIKLFCVMRLAGVYLDEVLCSSILGACAELTVLDSGQQVHATFIKAGFMSSLLLNNSLLALYGKCGCIEEAFCVFDSMQMRDLISWTAIIVGYAQNGRAMDSIKFHEKMLGSGIIPDSVSFLGLLFACSHAGLVDKGKYYFESMDKIYGIKPGPQHYGCMIDLLGRSGHWAEVKIMLNQMEVPPDASIWKALLAACRVHSNADLAERAAKNLFKLEPQNAVPYILLANIYSAAGRWIEAAKVRRLMRSKAINKERGCSWIEMEGKVHTFVSADRSHPQIVEIYSKVHEIIKLIKKAGYVPDTNFSLHDTDEKGKELGLVYHSEKLAVAFALLVLPPGLPVRIFKNIRGRLLPYWNVLLELPAIILVVGVRDFQNFFADAKCRSNNARLLYMDESLGTTKSTIGCAIFI
ncbi:hypothetical protein BVRB_013230 [Beta vulgaris subsp. vulgaris]|uniref:DYW domain-containing protein n=1 Tax=Beta vulgaris subsp. vulgaris TaxID=3555 RepID=A0A0J8B5E2_BETVV|nr:hypothetical protein BVRB_013230 [Beta vulgaris subsp. vulgaris]